MPKDTTSGETRGKGDAQRERQEQIRKRVLAEGSVQVD